MAGMNSIRHIARYPILTIWTLLLVSLSAIDTSAITPQSEKLYEGINEFLRLKEPNHHDALDPMRLQSPKYSYCYVSDCLHNKVLTKHIWNKPLPKNFSEIDGTYSFRTVVDDFDFKFGVYMISYYSLENSPRYYMLIANDSIYLFPSTISQMTLMNRLLEINKTNPELLPDEVLHNALSQITWDSYNSRPSKSTIEIGEMICYGIGDKFLNKYHN